MNSSLATEREARELKTHVMISDGEETDYY